MEVVKSSVGAGRGGRRESIPMVDDVCRCQCMLDGCADECDGQIETSGEGMQTGRRTAQSRANVNSRSGRAGVPSGVTKESGKAHKMAL